MRGGLGSGVVRVDRVLPVRHHTVVDPVLDIGCRIGGTEETLVVGFVFGEQQEWLSLAIEEIVTEGRICPGYGKRVSTGRVPHRWFRLLRPPCPDVAEPEGRQHVDHALLGPPVAYADLYQQIRRCGLRILHEDIEIPVFIEYAGVEQFVFGIRLTASSVRIYQIQVRICILRILIEVFRVRMRRGAIQVEIIFLDVLTVIGLAVGQPERPLLDYRVLAVPQRQRKTQPLVIVADTGEAVLTPVIGARAGLIVAEIIPRVPILAVVLADGAPLAFAEIWPPLPPGNILFPRLLETQRFSRRTWFAGSRLRHDCSL